MSVDSRLAATEKCDQCGLPPGVRCESAPFHCPYAAPIPDLPVTSDEEHDDG